MIQIPGFAWSLCQQTTGSQQEFDTLPKSSHSNFFLHSLRNVGSSSLASFCMLIHVPAKIQRQWACHLLALLPFERLEQRWSTEIMRKDPVEWIFFFSERERTLPSIKPISVLKWNVESAFWHISKHSPHLGLLVMGWYLQECPSLTETQWVVRADSLRPAAENGALLNLQSQCRAWDNFVLPCRYSPKSWHSNLCRSVS